MFRKWVTYWLLWNPLWGWDLPWVFPWKNSILLHKKWNFYNYYLQKLALHYKLRHQCLKYVKNKVKWRKDFCSSLLFIITKIICKNLRIRGYPEGGKTSTVDWTLPFLSLSHPLELSLIPLHPSMLKLDNTEKEVGGKMKRVGDTAHWDRLEPEWGRESKKFQGYLLSQIFPKSLTVFTIYLINAMKLWTKCGEKSLLDQVPGRALSVLLTVISQSNFRDGSEISLSKHEYLTGRLLLRKLKVSIRFQVLGAMSKFKREPHVLEGFGISLDDPGYSHLLWDGGWRANSTLELLQMCSASVHPLGNLL